jgi:hypothetical protein
LKDKFIIKKRLGSYIQWVLKFLKHF